MFLFGHLGIGAQLVRPLRKGLPLKWLFVGTLLPDLIDKPLYYVLVIITGRTGADIGLICGTRTFAHTALFLLGLTLLSVLRRSRVVAALALGAASHLFLDQFTDYFLGVRNLSADDTALLWPFLGNRFPVANFADAGEHLSHMIEPVIYWGELIGLGLLLREYWLWKQTRKRAGRKARA